MNLAELTPDEQLVLGGLLRLMIRTDGEFAEAEEREVDALGAALGGREAIWAIVSRSAQSMPTDDRIRAAVPSVTRPEARAVILAAVERVARQDGLTKSEQRVLDWLGSTWR